MAAHLGFVACYQSMALEELSSLITAGFSDIDIIGCMDGFEAGLAAWLGPDEEDGSGGSSG